MTERTFLDRFLAAVPVAVVALALLSLYFWQVAGRKAPTIFSDELEWTQISRAIAATGHAARRGEPISFKSLYAFLVAPAWWITSTQTAYAVAKYIGTVAMCLTAIPVYLTARFLVSPRAAAVAAIGSICTSALFYAGYLLPETLAYPTFALCAYLSIRALAGGGRVWIAAAIVADLAAIEVRNELVIVPASFAAAAAVLWLVGPRGSRLRAGWSRLDHAGAAVLLIGAFIVVNRELSPHSTQWNTVTQSWQDRMWTLGLTSVSALAIGLGLLPLIGGLASLWLPERKADPRWRAFASFTASAIVFCWLYTGIKAAYLSTTNFTRIEERNLIYLGPLLIVGTVVYFSARRPWLPGTLAAAATTAWLVLHYGYQLDYPYFEAPGYGVATLANRAWHWNQHDIRIGLAFACVVATLAALLPFAPRIPARARAVALALVAAATLTWMLAGEITASNGAAAGAKTYYDNLPHPVDWIDLSTGRAGTTFIGQNISQGDTIGVDLLEFWNRSVRNIWSLDGTAPAVGPVTTPDLRSEDGKLSSDPGLPYVVESNGVDLMGSVVDRRPGLTLLRLTKHPWRLRQAYYGVSSDGWIAATSGDVDYADGSYAYFGPGTAPGTLKVDVSRHVFCHNSPGTNAVVRIGPVALSEQRAPVVARPVRVERFHLADCDVRHIVLRISPPVAVQVHVSPTTLGTDYGLSDSRRFGAQVGFAFIRSSK